MLDKFIPIPRAVTLGYLDNVNKKDNTDTSNKLNLLLSEDQLQQVPTERWNHKSEEKNQREKPCIGQGVF